MNDTMLRLLLIPVVVLIVQFITRFISIKLSKPKYESNVQTPGTFQRVILNFLIVLDVIAIFFAVMGLIAGEREMALVFGGIALIFLIAVITVKRAYNTSYQENEEYFILNSGNKEYQVHYDNIVDWQPSFNEIKILDKTKADQKYIRVNIRLFKPEILLREIAEMAFEGKFKNEDYLNSSDPNREAETVYYLVDNQYGYLVEDYVKQIENQKII